MRTRAQTMVIGVLALGAGLAGCGDGLRGAPGAARAVPANLPIAFEEDGGRTDGARFQVHARGGSLYLGARGATFTLGGREGRSAAVDVTLPGARPGLRPAGEQRLPGVVNSYVGNDRRRWRTGLATYERVRYDRVWPGVDLVFHGRRSALEYDFVVAPGADPARVALRVGGEGRPRLDRDGDLVVATRAGRFVQRRPVIYQRIGGRTARVAGRFVLDGRTVRFAVGRYDRTRPLVIDPVILYATFNGGAAHDDALDVAVDPSGQATVVGYTHSADFPTQTPVDATLGDPATGDAFVTKLDASGSTRVFSTYLGGNAADRATAVALSGSNLIGIAGTTSSTDLPMVGPTQANHGGGSDAFAAVLSETGTLTFSTYYGAAGADQAHAVQWHFGTRLTIGGSTTSTTLSWPGATYDTSHGGGSDGFVTRWVGPIPHYAIDAGTYLGGGGDDDVGALAQDASNRLLVGGITDSPSFPLAGGPANEDAYVLRLSGSLTDPDLHLRHGGSGSEAGVGLAVDASARPVLSGRTTSADLPTANAIDATLGGGSDAFLARFSTDGALETATYLGDGDADGASDVAVAPSGHIWLVGSSFAAPTSHDAVVWRLDASAQSLLSRQRLGGQTDVVDGATSVAPGPSGTVYVAGNTRSADFPTLNGAQQTLGGQADGFVVRLTDAEESNPETTVTAGPDGPARGSTQQFSFGSDKPLGGFRCAMDSPTFTPCSQTQEFSGLATGSHTLRVRAFDGSGHLDPTPAVRTFSIYRTDPLPETVIFAGPEGEVSGSTHTFEFRGTPDEPGLTYACRLDGGAFAPCTSPQTYEGLAAGAHTFTVRLSDAQGTEDATPAERSFTVRREGGEPPAGPGPSAPPAEPVASFLLPGARIAPGRTVAFDASASTGAGLAYRWDFDGDGADDAFGVRVERRFDVPGPRSVTLRVIDEQGRTSTQTQRFEVATPGTWSLEYSPALPAADQPVKFEVVRASAQRRQAGGEPPVDLESTTHQWNFGENDDPDGDGRGTGGGRTTGDLVSALRVKNAVLTRSNDVRHSFSRPGAYNLQIKVPDADGTGVLLAQSIPVGAPDSRAGRQLFAGFTVPSAIPAGVPVVFTDISRVGTGGGNAFRGPRVAFEGAGPQNLSRSQVAGSGTARFLVDGKPCGAACATTFGGSVALTFDTPGRHVVTMEAQSADGRARTAAVSPRYGKPALDSATVTMEVDVQGPSLCPQGGDTPLAQLNIGDKPKQWISSFGGCMDQVGSEPTYSTLILELNKTGLRVLPKSEAWSARVLVQPKTGKIYSSTGTGVRLVAGYGGTMRTIDVRQHYELGKDNGVIELNQTDELKVGRLDVTEGVVALDGQGNATATLSAKLPAPFDKTIKVEVPAAAIAGAKPPANVALFKPQDFALGPVTLSDVSLHYRAPSGEQPLFTAGAKAAIPGLGTLDATDNFLMTQNLPVQGLRLLDTGAFKAAGLNYIPDVPIHAGPITLHEIGGSISVDPFQLDVSTRLDILETVVKDLEACATIISAGADKAGKHYPTCGGQKAHAEYIKMLEWLGLPKKTLNLPEVKKFLAELFAYKVPKGGGFVFDLDGEGKLLGIAPMHFRVRAGTGEGVMFSGRTHWNILNADLVSVAAHVRGNIKSAKQWQLDAGVKLCALFISPDTCSGGELVVSSKGIGGCAYMALMPDPGGWYRWGGGFGIENVMFGGCDISAIIKKVGIRGLPTARALLENDTGPRALGAPSETIELKRGVRSVVGVTAAEVGVSPVVDVVDPGGRVVLTDTGANAEQVLHSEKLATTYLFFTPARTGTYTLRARSGSIAQVNYAEQLPRPRVVATVSGDGATRTVDVQATTLPGQRVTLYEEGDAGGPIGVVRNTTRAVAASVQPLQAQMASKRTQLRFRPADPSGDRRTVVAVVEDADGTPRARYELASFRAPKPPPPPRPRLVRARVKGSTLQVRWAPGKGSAAQTIVIAQGNGTRIVERLGGRTSRFVLRGYPVTAGARISVTAQSAEGKTGPASTARVKKRKPPKRRPLRI